MVSVSWYIVLFGWKTITVDIYFHLSDLFMPVSEPFLLPEHTIDLVFSALLEIGVRVVQ